GAIGPVRFVHATYLTGPVKPMPPASARPTGMSDVEWQIRNWYNFVWLSGDGLIEQACHSVDKILWAVKDVPPVRCVATGGRGHPRHDGTAADLRLPLQRQHGLPRRRARHGDGALRLSRDDRRHAVAQRS